jgi:hypothetical protein
LSSQSRNGTLTTAGFISPSIVIQMRSALSSARLIGPPVGAFVMIVLTDQASELTEHWKLIVGALVIAITLFSRHGIVGLAQNIGTRLFDRTST